MENERRAVAAVRSRREDKQNVKETFIRSKINKGHAAPRNLVCRREEVDRGRKTGKEGRWSNLNGVGVTGAAGRHRRRKSEMKAVPIRTYERKNGEKGSRW